MAYWLVALGCFGVAGTTAADEVPASPARPAMRMYRDPDTGRIGAPPAVGVADAAPAAEQVQSQAAAAPSAEMMSDRNGVKVKLNGRFRAAVRRSAAAGGAAHECTQDEAAGHD